MLGGAHTAGSPLTTLPEEGPSLRVSSVRLINIKQVPTASQLLCLKGIKRWRPPFTLGKDRHVNDYSEMAGGLYSLLSTQDDGPALPFAEALRSALFCFLALPLSGSFTHP